jgi:hypothetical protein
LYFVFARGHHPESNAPIRDLAERDYLKISFK